MDHLGNSWKDASFKLAEYGNILIGVQTAFQMLEDIVVLLNKPPMPHDERYALAYKLWDKGQDIGEEINTLVYTKDQWDSAPPSLFKYNVREEGI